MERAAPCPTKHILVVDDDLLILYALGKGLKNTPYKVKTSATTATAIEELKTCCYDLCILDLHLRNHNGLSLSTIVREISPYTTIVIMTAYNFDCLKLDESIREAVELSGCYFIAKPFDLSDLIAQINYLLEEKNDVHNSCPFAFGNSGRKTRNSRRKPHNKNIHFQINVIDKGENKRSVVEAKTTDISETGLGLTTLYPLKAYQVISFGEKMENRTGVVVWSLMVDEQSCRAGIKFG